MPQPSSTTGTNEKISTTDSTIPTAIKFASSRIGSTSINNIQTRGYPHICWTKYGHPSTNRERSLRNRLPYEMTYYGHWTPHLRTLNSGVHSITASVSPLLDCQELHTILCPSGRIRQHNRSTLYSVLSGNTNPLPPSGNGDGLFPYPKRQTTTLS